MFYKKACPPTRFFEEMRKQQENFLDFPVVKYMNATRYKKFHSNPSIINFLLTLSKGFRLISNNKPQDLVFEKFRMKSQYIVVLGQSKSCSKTQSVVFDEYKWLKRRYIMVVIGLYAWKNPINTGI
jgi:hypothetical protein